MLHIAQVEHLDEDENEGGKLWTVYRRELRLMDTIRRMEDRGIRLDLERNNEVREFYDDYVERIGKKIGKHVPEGFNPNSPKQMAEEFFGKRDYTPLEYGSKKTRDGVVYSPCQHCATPMLHDDGTPVKRPKTTKNGKVIQQVVKHSPGCKVCQYTGKNPKCNSDFLSQIAGSNEPNPEDPDGDDIYVMKDELAYYLCEHTACTNMLNFVNSYDLLRHEAETDGVPYWVLSPNYKQCGPITGRLSCTKPNMMNVASDSTGRKRSNVPYRTRECFVPRKGYTLYMPDYSQIEVWVFASLSQDPDFLATLLSGEDFHGGIAKRVWGHLWDQEAAEAAEHKDPSKMTKLEAQASATKKYYRKRAKLLMFCKLYGGGAAKVASLLECTRSEAESFIADYDARLPGVRKFMSEMVSIAKRDGFVTNPFGRTYPINRQLAYRATNYMVQGTSAEIMKNALNYVDELCYTDPRYVGKMFPLLTVHDEIILEVANELDDKRTMLDIVRCMQNDHKIVGCPKPFPVGMKVAKERWSVTHEIESSYYDVAA
jgi:DNA polymerase I-like protein with 3'-5' exonuclease and polymerase domains